MPNPIKAMIPNQGQQQAPDIYEFLGSMKNSNQNPQMIINQMIQNNPNLQQCWQQAQTMAGQNQDTITLAKQICQQKGLDFDRIASIFGIKR